MWLARTKRIALSSLTECNTVFGFVEFRSFILRFRSPSVNIVVVQELDDLKS